MLQLQLAGLAGPLQSLTVSIGCVKLGQSKVARRLQLDEFPLGADAGIISQTMCCTKGDELMLQSAMRVLKCQELELGPPANDCILTRLAKLCAKSGDRVLQLGDLARQLRAV